MLLRRITQHVKEQNWFAVGIDFFIVVIGVFIGIQVANWNDARVERENKRALILRLDVQFQNLETVLLQRIDRAQGLVDSTSDLIAIIRNEDDVHDSNAIKDMLYDSRRYNAQVPPPTAYTDALQSGRIGNLSNSNLREALYEYEISKDWWTTITGPAEPQTDSNAKLNQALTLSAEKTPEISFRTTVLGFDWQGIVSAEKELVEIHHRQSLQAEAYRLELEGVRNVLVALNASREDR